MLTNNKGYSLTELLIATVIVAVLTAFAIPQYNNVMERQRATDAITLISIISQAQERYAMVQGKYTTNFADLNVDLVDSAGNPASGSTLTTKAFKYNISGTSEANGQVVAARTNGKYAFARIHSQGETCCKRLTDLTACELFTLELCT
jgi:prepilin-type N-terminal cleavage/methylation domain-containing protein